MTLGAAIEQYISWKRSLGAGFDSPARMLRSYGRSVGEETVCDEATRAQARGFVDRGTPAPSHRALKHSTLERFYRYAIGRGLASKSPLPTEAPRGVSNFRPYIYASDEVRSLLGATETYRKHHRQLEPHTFRTLLLLLHGTGLRHGEALRLTLRDVDLPKRLLTVRGTKFSKTRLVPLAPQLVPALERYAVRRRVAASAVHGNAPFFANRDGTPLVQVTVCRAYAQLRRAAGVRREDGGRFQPRLHDFRHSFAVKRLTAAYRRGEDVQRLLPRLSTYLGHVSIASTQAYLTMTPDLLEEAALRFERYAATGRGGGRG